MRRLLPCSRASRVRAAHRRTRLHVRRVGPAGHPAAIAQSGPFLYYTPLEARVRSVKARSTASRRPGPWAAAARRVLVPGPGDNHLWFVDPGNSKVGRSTRAALWSSRPCSRARRPISPPAAREDLGRRVRDGKLACVTTAGAVTETRRRTERGGRDHPRRRRLDVDGRHGGQRLARLFTPGDVRDSRQIGDFPPARRGPVDIASAPTGNDLYVAANNALVNDVERDPPTTPVDRLGLARQRQPPVGHSNAGACGGWTRSTSGSAATATVVSEWALPRGSGVPNEFTLASDGSVWYTRRPTTGSGASRRRPARRATGPTGAPGRRRRPRARRATAGASGRHRRAPARPAPTGATGATGRDGRAGRPGRDGAQGPPGAGSARRHRADGATGAARRDRRRPAPPARAARPAGGQDPEDHLQAERPEGHARSAQSGGSGAAATRAAARACACGSAARARSTPSAAARRRARAPPSGCAVREVPAGGYTLAVDVGDERHVHRRSRSSSSPPERRSRLPRPQR